MNAKLPSDQDEFRARVVGKTRKQITDAFGEPDEYRDDETGAWDGLVVIYRGEFAGPGGKKTKPALLFFKRSATGTIVVTRVIFG